MGIGGTIGIASRLLSRRRSSKSSYKSRYNSKRYKNSGGGEEEDYDFDKEYRENVIETRSSKSSRSPETGKIFHVDPVYESSSSNSYMLVVIVISFIVIGLMIIS